MELLRNVIVYPPERAPGAECPSKSSPEEQARMCTTVAVAGLPRPSKP